LNSGQQPADTLHDNAIGWALALFVMAVLIWLFWWYFHAEVREVIRWIRYSEMWILSWFLADDYTITMANGREIEFHQAMEYVKEYDKDKLKYDHLAMFGALTMQPLRWPFIIILGLGTLWCMFLGPNTQHRKRMDLEDLIGALSRVFPVISPFVKFNPSTQPPRPPGAPVPVELPLFAEALGPEEWVAYNSIKVPDGKIDEVSAAQAFVAQLGRPWRGSKQLAPYKQVLLASFCLKVSRKREQSDDILGRLARCWSYKNGLDLKKDSKLLKEAQSVLKDKGLSGSTLAQCNRHAFEATALIRALQFAREEGGVLAPAAFVWLRAHDRTLWYPLNNVGRQSFHMEALGAMSHFKAEKITQRPIPVPKVEHAVQTIKEYMESIQARPIPQLDYSKSKKRGVKKAT